MAVYKNTETYVSRAYSIEELGQDIYDMVANETNVLESGRQLFAVQRLEDDDEGGELYLLSFGELVKN